ncbi:hypothetical protein NKR23_g754 [Pleurostoma richardsiae]|uniref:F-box domain-containing protein n=1 Tax=Pleurostoma richardsiae TaxID=41990 RepID=A0AA38VY21_9PEZI|nr:hypothetical protein NKR23_g754 [Pleurostoma richardsiae]
MASMKSIPRLPLELILHIITCLVPSNPAAFLPLSTSSTKTLIAFTLVCRATSPVAKRLLRQHCLSITSSSRLRDLLLCISIQAASPSPSPDRAALRSLTSLYLAPFPPGRLDDLPTALWVRELFLTVSGTLTRLVVDMPLRSLWPADDHLDVRANLRQGFEALARLEELVCVRDELFLRVSEPEWHVDEGPPLWASAARWPRLRRLALYNADAGAPGFWRAVGAAPRLETLVLTRADGLEEGVCPKTEYFAVADRPLTVVLVDVEARRPEGMPRWRWRDVDPEGRMRVAAYDVPTSFYGDEDEIELCQEWVKGAALRGTLWGWEHEGILLEAAPAPGQAHTG